MELRGVNRAARVTGADKLTGVANYYIGNDAKKWRSGITTYGKVKYQGIYPGVDAVFYGNQRQLEYDFVVAPGADPRQISLGLTGAEPSLDADGNVVLKLTDGDLALKKPVVYQNIAGEKKPVDAGYIVAGNRVSFRLGKYDRNQTLVIDPVFTYLTYLGGSSVDYIGGITGVNQTTSPTHALAIDSADNFPTSLGGVSVTIDGKQAYLWYVSPTQINLQAPDDTATGSVTVVVTTPNGTTSSTVTLAPFAPSFSLLDTKHVAGIILRSNGSGAYGGGSYDIIGPTGTALGYATVAAKAGDAVELFGVGFGPTSPPVAAGAIFSGSAPTTNAVSLRINNVSVNPSFAGLSGVGLYQINFTVRQALARATSRSWQPLAARRHNPASSSRCSSRRP